MCELLVGLVDVNIDAVDHDQTSQLRITVSSRQPAPACETCGGQRRLKDRSTVELVDLPAFAQPARQTNAGPLADTDHQLASPSGAEPAPPKGANNMIKLAKRIGFGFQSFRNHRIRALLYAGRPNWGLLDTLLPTQNR